MEKAHTDPIAQERIGDILRVTRRHLGINQMEVAPRLGLDQSALSRVESGKQILTHAQWLVFCRYAGISPEATSLGTIEPEQPESAIRLPERYAFEKHSKVRSLLPILSYAKSTLGDGGFRSFLEANKLHADYFLNLNAEINFNFTIDLAEALIRKTRLRDRDAEGVTRTARDASSHGMLYHHYDCVFSDQLQLVLAYIQQASKYGRYFGYEVLDATPGKLEIAVTLLPELNAFDYGKSPILGDFLAHYGKGYFQNFSAYGGQTPLQVTLLENHYAGGGKPRCVYRLKLASFAGKVELAA